MFASIKGDVLSKIDEMRDELITLSTREVVVGIPAESDEIRDGINLASIAMVLEYGSPAKNIPSRPFLRQTLIERQDEYVAFYKKQMDDGKTAEQAMKLLAKKAQADVQDNIVKGRWAPNSALTVGLKGSSKPLIDTGSMRQAIRGIVRDKE